MDKANEKSGSIQVKKLRDAGKNYNPKTKSVVGLPKLPEATPEQIAKRITNIKKIAPKSSGATALLNSLKKK